MPSFAQWQNLLISELFSMHGNFERISKPVAKLNSKYNRTLMKTTQPMEITVFQLIQDSAGLVESRSQHIEAVGKQLLQGSWRLCDVI